MQINVTFDQITANLPAGFVSAVNYVVNYFDNLFTNPTTLTIDVGYGEIVGSSLGSGTLGASEATGYVAPSYSSVVNALQAQSAPGASTLPSTSPLPGTLYIPQAEAKALGVIPNNSNLDGYVGLSNTGAWDYTTAAPPAGQYY